MSGLSTDTAIPLATLLAANKGSDKIKVGQKLDLEGTTYTIKSVNFTHYCSGEADPTGPKGTCGCTLKKPGDKGFGECADLSTVGAGTLAADWTKIPPGSTLSWTHAGASLSGTVHDRGAAIKEFDIDVWCLSHKVAEENGKYKEPATVTLPK